MEGRRGGVIEHTYILYNRRIWRKEVWIEYSFSINALANTHTSGLKFRSYVRSVRPISPVVLVTRRLLTWPKNREEKFPFLVSRARVRIATNSITFAVDQLRTDSRQKCQNEFTRGSDEFDTYASRNNAKKSPRQTDVRRLYSDFK